MLRKCNNGINFEIEYQKDRKRKIIHHNRLHPYFKPRRPEKFTTDISDSSSNTDSSSSDDNETSLVPESRYQNRNRRQPVRGGYIPWDVVDNALDSEP